MVGFLPQNTFSLFVDVTNFNLTNLSVKNNKPSLTLPPRLLSLL